MNLEHGLIFWLAGLITILLISLLAYSTTYGRELGAVQGVNFVIAEADVIGQKLTPVVGIVFLLVVGLFLFGTQLSVMDASSRILAENTLLLLPKLGESKLRQLFYVALWTQIGAGIAVLSLGMREPLLLLTIGAVLNAVAMLVHTALMLRMNTTSLAKVWQPSWVRRVVLGGAIMIFAGFSGFSLMQLL